jgi:hypothetical protein
MGDSALHLIVIIVFTREDFITMRLLFPVAQLDRNNSLSGIQMYST